MQSEATTPAVVSERYTELLCISAQIYKLDAGTWRELTKDFVLLHVYYDAYTQLTKLIALDGIKLVIKDLVLSPCLSLTRPTKKFVHFLSSVYGRSEMYGFGLRKAEDAALFINQVNRLSKKLSQLVTSSDKVSRNRVPFQGEVYPTAFASPVHTLHSIDVERSMESIWKEPIQVFRQPVASQSQIPVELAFQDMSLSDDDFTGTAVPSVLGAIDAVYRTPTKQYLKDNRVKADSDKED